MNRWFDEETGICRLDEVVAERETFKKIMTDGMVTDMELAAQSDLVLDLLHQLENRLDETTLMLVQDTLAELVVLYSITQYYTLQQLDK